MKSAALVCAIAAVSLGFSSLSFAQEYERRGSDHQAQRIEQRHPMTKDHRDGRIGPRDAHHPQHPTQHPTKRAGHDARAHGVEQPGFDPRNAHNERPFNAHGPQFHRGGRIPQEYRNRQYVVDDWRAHRLSPPPRGHHWVQVGADYVLIAIATGIIVQLVLSQ